MSRFAKFLAGAVFVLALPIFLFVANLLWTTLDVGTYERAFFGYGAAERTGFSADQLHAVAVAFVAHFRNGVPLELTVAMGGQTAPMFTEREIVHLRDVHDLVQFGLRALAALGAYLLLFAVVGVRWWRGVYGAALAGYVRAGALLTLAILLGLAASVFVAFDQLFVLFHVLSFPNDFWMLDPSRHYLINLFSQQFFLDTTLLVAVMTGAEALLLALGASGFLWWRAKGGPADWQR